jgi:hypothetical protein
VVQAVAKKDYARAVSQLRVTAGPSESMTAEALEEAMTPYFEEYEEIYTDPSARSPKHLVIEKGDTWRLRQILVDPSEDYAWALVFQVDLAASREAGVPVIHLRSAEND